MKVDSVTEPHMLLFNSIFTKLIGHLLENTKTDTALFTDVWNLKEWKEYEETKNDQTLVDEEKKAKLKELLSMMYEPVLDKVLTSSQYDEEGFFYLHQERFSLDKDSTSIFDVVSDKDFVALQLEMVDLAQTDNYWDILSYRDRWVALTDLAPTGAEQQGNNSENEDDREEPISWCSCWSFLKGSPVVGVERCEESYGKELADGEDYAPPDETQEYGVDWKMEHRAMCISELKRFTNSLSEEAEWTDAKLIETLSLGANLSALRRFSPPLGIEIKLPVSIKTRKTYIPEGEEPIKADTDFIKVRINNEDIQGLHASPFWLARQHTSEGNQHLHRARAIYNSWFCEGISPDAATKSGSTPSDEEIARFVSDENTTRYFAADDEHTTGDINCFACHKRVQPIANYFGKMSLGYNADDLSAFQWRLQERFFALDKAFDRPGGYYNAAKGKFSEFGHSDDPNDLSMRGMAGLADLLSNLPKARRCIVESTWNRLFGVEWKLSDTEVNEAITEFEKANFNYKKLLRYLLAKEKAKTYFVAGEKEFETMVIAERSKEEIKCEEIEDNVGKWSKSIINKSCTGDCHGTHNSFLDNEGSLRENLKSYNFEKILCHVVSGYMPQGEGYLDNDTLLPEHQNSGDRQKEILECFLNEKIQRAETVSCAVDTPTGEVVDH